MVASPITFDDMFFGVIMTFLIAFASVIVVDACFIHPIYVNFWTSWLAVYELSPIEQLGRTSLMLFLWGVAGLYWIALARRYIER